MYKNSNKAICYSLVSLEKFAGFSFFPVKWKKQNTE